VPMKLCVFFLSSVPKNLAVMRFFIFHVPKIADLLSNSGVPWPSQADAVALVR